MKLNKEKLIFLIVDAIQIFHDNKDYYNQKENLTALEDSLSKDGKSTSQLMVFINSNVTVSSWYQEAKFCVNVMHLDDDSYLDVQKLENSLCMVDLIAGFSLYNLIEGAKLDYKITACLEN